jgi:hypothetical protein
MLINLYSSAGTTRIASYRSPVVPRVGEFLRLNGIPDAVMRVIEVCYDIQPAPQESECVDLRITAENVPAQRYLGQTLYMRM